MGLRFAIIKSIKTTVGNNEESVVFEHDEHEVLKVLRRNLRSLLNRSKEKPILGERKWTEDEVVKIFDNAWGKTVENFKKVTVKIL